jgi:[ribosomal protein S5]-alanine N-acetyltransferase
MAARVVGSIRTAHLDLVPLTTPFVDAVVAGHPSVADSEVRARVGTWLTADPSHLVQLHLAGREAEAMGFPGLGRTIVLDAQGRPRKVIGSIGFHGPPDERGRMEASCRIHPAHRGRGYAAEALGALLDWATVQYGVSRFLVAVFRRRAGEGQASLKIAIPFGVSVELVADLLEAGASGTPGT